MPVVKPKTPIKKKRSLKQPKRKKDRQPTNKQLD